MYTCDTCVYVYIYIYICISLSLSLYIYIYNVFELMGNTLLSPA